MRGFPITSVARADLEGLGYDTSEVDDVREAPQGWTVCRTILNAILAISTLEVEEISLDHDNGAGECFCPVAYYVAQKYRDSANPPKITIHSSNPVGAREMQLILEREGGLPCELRPW